MAEKRTKADKLQRSIERAEKRVGPSPEEAVNTLQETLPLRATPDPTQLEEEIRHCAFWHYEARGCVAGHELDDWLQSEAEIRRKRRAVAA